MTQVSCHQYLNKETMNLDKIQSVFIGDSHSYLHVEWNRDCRGINCGPILYLSLKQIRIYDWMVHVYLGGQDFSANRN